MEKSKVVTRFAPSPTGFLHIGGVRTALYNWLFARQNNGKFLLRIEDTDRGRNKKEFEDNIFNSLKWLGLEHDGKVLRQSERSQIYKAEIQALIKKGAAYLAEEQNEPRLNPNTNSQGLTSVQQVVRFKNPGGKIKFNDLIRGEVEMEVGDLNDFIIAKNIDEPLYHLAVVVDDIESGVSHIIRGEDHISNTPRQILIARALGKKDDFIYAHLPLVLAKDKSKLSKRKHGELVSLNFYRDRGYSKEAILNFMALIGWNPGTDQEIFSLEELVKEFNLSKVQKKGAIFDIKKLEWMNRAYLLKQAKDIQISNLKSQILETKRKDSERWKETEFVEKFLKIVLDRIHRWREVRELLDNGEFDYLFESSGLIPEKLIWKTDSKEKTKESLEKVLEVLENKEEIMKLAEKVGKGSVLWPLRYALSGREKSPDPMTLIDILGIEESKKRIEKAIKII